MTQTTWTEPVQALIARLPVTPVALWSLLTTAALAASQLALVPPLDDDLSLTEASEDLRGAAFDLEVAHPLLSTSGVLLDVGPAPVDDLDGCRRAISALIHGASQLASKLIAQPGQPAAQQRVLRQVLVSVSVADARLTGGQP